MSKIIYIDVGTHFGQEFKSLFGNKLNLLYPIIRRVIGYYICRRGIKIDFKTIKNIFQYNNFARQNRKNFLTYFVEANSKIINNSNVYKMADGIFNCALTNNSEFNFANLFLVNNDSLGQSSSIFKDKKNASLKNSIITLGIPASSFFYEFKKYIDQIQSEYSVILRLNCEGVEDDVIYAAHKVFKEKLVLTLGSLKDVEEIKGKLAHKQMQKYIKDNLIPFTYFSSEVYSWEKAHQAILDVLNKHQY